MLKYLQGDWDARGYYQSSEAISTISLQQIQAEQTGSHRGTADVGSWSYLRDIHTLDMSCCDQETITDKAFSYLRGINTLNMKKCRQLTITDEAFSYLRGINTLYIDYTKHKRENIEKQIGKIPNIII